MPATQPALLLQTSLLSSAVEEEPDPGSVLKKHSTALLVASLWLPPEPLCLVGGIQSILGNLGLCNGNGLKHSATFEQQIHLKQQQAFVARKVTRVGNALKRVE